ncbi:PEP-CTERM sorting domain-containing protein [Verrucomicrobiaceae bacterium N1E253]|uniref:PEP-CTERM sorting domain-containing protein n=1 Tax=Oceaniferula marina TaxID=2748318 RepID=A0A851GL13_9BACT|nr:LamG-like jellyroll fold domain-containing protein [Oceaniferula marina]NWK55420.1 PEP-CTERM sorting domain-containing protein [Oceaniferula marina]
MTRLCLLLISTFLASASYVSAGLVAHYDFTDGDLTDNEVGANYTLTHVQNGTGAVSINADGSAAFPGNDSSSGNHAFLETAAYGTTGVANFTVSFWWKTNNLAQGNYQGLFSSDDANASFSWQLDNSGSNMRFVSNGSPTLTYAESNLSTDTWYHTVIRKETGAGDNYTQVYITSEGGVTPVLVMNQNSNPGGLNEFRLGVNRNSDSLFAMDMANVKIYNDASVDLSSLLAEGPGLVPEPSSTALLGLGGLALILRRRK